MTKEAVQERARAINKIAQAQTLSGRLLVIGEGMVASNIVQSPYRILDNCPVYHSCVNEFDLSDLEFERKKVHKWGEFYHPCLMFGSPSVGGNNKVYIDTRTNGWYVMWISSKLDEADFGPSDWSPDIVAWTPKQKNDSIKKAGYRLFWAASLRMDYVENEELYSQEFEGDGYWNTEWSCSQPCFQVLASVRETRYRSDTEFKKILSKTPSFLKPHLMARRIPK